MIAGLRRVSQKLGVRLAVLMALALLPLGIVAYAQTKNLAREAQARTEAALMGATLRAAAGEVGAIRQARGLVEGLAADSGLLVGDGARCNAAMADAKRRVERVVLLNFVSTSGMMRCSSNGMQYDYSDDPLFLKVRDDPEPSFLVNKSGPVTGQSVLGVLEPVFDAEGRKTGFVSAWLPHSQLNERVAKEMLTDRGGDRSSISFWTFDRQGEVLTASLGLDGVRAILPANHRLGDVAAQQDGVFRDVTASGEERTYAVVPLADGELYLMSNWNSRDVTTWERLGVDPRLFPLLMWVAGLLVSIWAAELLVGRHVRVLHRSIKAFASGDRRRQEIDLGSAPLELRQMAEAYLSMTDSITHDEAHLEDTIHQKDVLLREVHHRVKNNLQLIASIMNMQLRQSRNPEARSVLRSLHDRIMSLATIHRGLYQTSGLADVRADELLPDIVRQIVDLGSGPVARFEVSERFDDIRLIPDQAVPLSLLLTEAMTNAIKYGGSSEGRKGSIHVSLTRIGPSEARLSVTNSVSPGEDRPRGESFGLASGLGAQLVSAFAQQVGGHLVSGMVGDTYVLTVEFPVSALSNAEHRDHPAGRLSSDRKVQID